MEETSDLTHITPTAQKICIIGNLNIDLIIRGIADFPKWGQEVSGYNHVAASAGQAGYLALALSHLGMHPSVVANVGNDTFGMQILGDLAAVETDASSVEIESSGKTGISVGIVRTDGERAFISDFASMQLFDEQLVYRHWDKIEEADIVCLVGIFCLPSFSFEAATEIFSRAKGLGKTTVLDTGWDPGNWSPSTLTGIRSLLRETCVFIPNHDEATVITGTSDTEEAARVLQSFGPELVVVKCGESGSFALHHTSAYQAPAIPTIVYDTVGAGDVYNAGFLYGLSQDWSIADCMTFGNASASIYVSRSLKRFPSRYEVAEHVSKASFRKYHGNV